MPAPTLTSAYTPHMPYTIDELTKDLRDFATERGWERFHLPKNLAMGLAGEAGELVAEFQWLTPEEAADLTPEQREAIGAEMADVLMYLTRLADVTGIDLMAATAKKLDRNANRFPVNDSGVTSVEAVSS